METPNNIETVKGKRDFTVPEALKIVDRYFPDHEFSWDYLFESDNDPS